MRVVLALLLTVTAFGQSGAPAIETIRKDELKADLFFLASDAMRGRLTGTPEYALAAEWIAARYARLGLQPVATGGSFYHRFDLVLSRLTEGNRLVVSTGPDSRRVARQGEDFYPLIFTTDADRIRIPVLQISPALAGQILGRELGPLLEEAVRGTALASYESDVTIDIAASLQRSIVADRSLIAKVEGSDPQLKSEAVLI